MYVKNVLNLMSDAALGLSAWLVTAVNMYRERGWRPLITFSV